MIIESTRSLKMGEFMSTEIVCHVRIPLLLTVVHA